MDKILVGIDGGGTKTLFVACDNNGIVLEKFTLGCSNPNNIGVDKTIDILKSGMNRIMETHKGEYSVFAGIAGVLSGNFIDYIEENIKLPYITKFLVGSDMQSALAAAFNDNDGLVIIGGTGSSCYLKCNNNYFRVGGAGYLLDDGGSGFSIGCEGVKSVIKQLDGRGKRTLLTPIFNTLLGNLPDNLANFYCLSVPQIASFSKYVFDCYLKGDEVCNEILDYNADYILQLIESGFNKSNLANHDIALSGGLFQHNNILLDILHKKTSKYNFFVLDKPIVYGCIVKALKQANISVSIKFTKTFLQTFFNFKEI